MAPELIILAVSLLLLVFYYACRNYDSLMGVLLFATAFLIFGARIIFVRSSAYFFQESTLIVSGLLACVLTFVVSLIIFLFRKNHKYVSLKYSLVLFVLYLLFGFVQQVFFQYVFAEILFYISNNIFMTVLISGFFYSLFHLKIFDFFSAGTFVIGVLWTAVYLVYGNIIWISLSHAVLATLYYVFWVKEDPLRERLSFLRKVKM